MKIRPVVAELFAPCRPADRHDEAITASLNFSIAPKNAFFPSPSRLSEVVPKACRRVSDLAEHSGALHDFDSLIPMF
jgi:hypothetical protein